MKIGKLIKGLLGGNKEVVISDDPFGRNTPPIPGVTGAVAPPTQSEPVREPSVVVHRDEIIGERSRIAGYSFRAHSTDNSVRPSVEGALAALKADNVITVAQRRLALLPLRTEDWQSADFRPLIAPLTTFLIEPPAAGSDSTAWIAVLDEIKSTGGRVGIDSAAASSFPAALDRASLVLIDFGAYSLEAFERVVRNLAATRPELELLAGGIGSWAEHRMCQALGLRYSLGGFAAAPDEEEQGEKLNQSQLVLIEMLNLLRRDADLEDLVAVAKRDPGVAVKVVEMANSPMSGLSAPVASLDQALMVLGRQMLYRWLSLGIYRAGSSGRDEALLEIALTRARFLELVALGNRPKQESDELFLVGMLSLLDSLLGMPMAAALGKIHLPQFVVDVLLKSEGPYGRFLMLALAMEKGRSEQAAKLAEDLGIDAEKLEESHAAAFAWAQTALTSS
jgi:EAL and modified HD-GYP domain-containing signal transduction protein